MTERSGMELYRMELYKICHRKILWIIGGIMIIWLAFYFYVELITTEQTMVDGVIYHGYEAIQKDREITEEFEGTLTDEKIEQIVETYGFPSKVKLNVSGWEDSNYLTNYVTDHFSDGYMMSWDNYEVPKHVVSIADSGETDYLKNPEDTMYFGYAKGNEQFLAFFQTECYFVSVWLIVALAPLFCEERQSRMRQIILTTERGRKVDIRAKMLAAFTVTGTAYLVMTLIPLLVCWKIFGFAGNAMKAGMVIRVFSFYSLSKYTIGTCTFLYLLISLGALFMLTATGIWISARAKTNFASVLTGIAVWVLPAVVQVTFGNGLTYLFAGAMPFFLTNYISFSETWWAYGFHVVVTAIMTIVGIMQARRGWLEVDAE